MLGQQAQPIQIQLSPDGKITWIDQTAEAAIRSYAAANAAMKPAIRQEIENAIDTRNQWLARAKQLTQAEISAILDSIIR
jgi:hypothetical protein